MSLTCACDFLLTPDDYGVADLKCSSIFLPVIKLSRFIGGCFAIKTVKYLNFLWVFYCTVFESKLRAECGAFAKYDDLLFDTYISP